MKIAFSAQKPQSQLLGENQTRNRNWISPPAQKRRYSQTKAPQQAHPFPGVLQGT